MKIVTVANDRMIDFFRRFLRSWQIYSPSTPITVIPFDDYIEDVARLAAEHNIELATPDPDIDGFAQDLFEQEEYRPGIEAWRYMRKLNAFRLGDEPFCFIDANSVILSDLEAEVVAPILEPLGDGIAYYSTSIRGRTINEPSLAFLNAMNPTVENGYNASFFVATSKFLDVDICRMIARDTPARTMISRAPEQGFLALYLAYSGRKAHHLANLLPECGINHSSIYGIVKAPDGTFRFSSGPSMGKRVYALKWTGQVFSTPAQDAAIFGAEADCSTDGSEPAATETADPPA